MICDVQETPNSSMIEIGFRNGNFLYDEFLGIDEIKKDLELYALQ